MAVVAAFCLVFVFLVSRFAATTSATYDETLHLPAGYSYLLWNDYRMGTGHPPLVKKLAALPLLAAGAWPGKKDFAGQETETADVSWLRRYWELGLVDPNLVEWKFARGVLFGIREDSLRRFGVTDPESLPPSAALGRADFLNDTDQLLFRSRMMILVLGAALALLVYSWAREWFGMAGGVLALALYCFDPNFIAHSGLVTTDVGVTVFMFGAVYFLWRTCRRLSVFNVVLTALLFSLAFATKFSAVLLLPVFVLIGLGRVLAREDWLVGRQHRLTGPWRKALALAGVLAACLGAAFVMVWAAYGFRYSAVADPRQSVETMRRLLPGARVEHEPGTLPITKVVHRTAAIRFLLKQHPQGVSEAGVQNAMPSAPLGISGTLELFAQRHHLLPEGYLYGLAHEEMKSLIRASYLMGEYSSRGFRSYFLWCFLFKTPLPSLLLMAISLVVVLRRRMPWCLRLAFLAVPVGIYALMAVGSTLNIGHRHLLPVYPFLFVGCGVLAADWAGWKPAVRRWTAIGGLAAVALSSLVVFAPPWKPAVVYPHYLAYFNELAGGPRNGYNRLVDSNLDWGQDLKGLKQWMNEKGVDRINLCYFGMADPRYYGIACVDIPSGYDQDDPMADFVQNSDGSFSIRNAVVPGYLAISATNLKGAYLTPLLRTLWRGRLNSATLVDTIGYSIFIYKLDHASFRVGEQDVAEAIPNSAEAYCDLGNTLFHLGRIDAAMAQYREALRLDPAWAEAHNNLGSALLKLGQEKEAMAHYEKALELQPDLALAADNLAGVLVQAALRNGDQAVAYAERANRLSGGRDAYHLQILAAAYGQKGRFADAIATVQQAVRLASTQTNAALADSLQQQIRIYQKGSKFELEVSP